MQQLVYLPGQVVLAEEPETIAGADQDGPAFFALARGAEQLPEGAADETDAVEPTQFEVDRIGFAQPFRR